MAGNQGLNEAWEVSNHHGEEDEYNQWASMQWDA